VASYPVTLWYRTKFEASVVPANLRLFIDGFSGSGYQLFINGCANNDRGTRSKLDAEIREINIAPYVHEGSNSIAVRLVVGRRTDGILDLLKLVGDFALEERSEGTFAIIPANKEIAAGDWTAQGYPFYSGTGIYRVEFDLPERYTGGKLFLEADCGEDVLEVCVNGSKGMIAPWHPYRIDVSEFVRGGTNTLELCVTNTLINVLEGVRKASGLLSALKLVHHHTYQLSEQGKAALRRGRVGKGRAKQKRK
jgi:hypothetical protein